jgi:hypothetical protein
MAEPFEIELHRDIEELYRLHLKKVLNMIGSDVKVYSTTTPAKLPNEFVLITQTGGGEITNKVFDRVQLAFDVRSIVSQTEALNLARIIAGLVNTSAQSIDDETPVYSVEQLTGPYLAPDYENDKYHRFITTFIVNLRTERKNINESL